MRTVIAIVLILCLTVPASARLTYDALVRSARIYLGQTPKDFDNAQAKLEEAIEKFPNKHPIEAYLLLGSLHAEKGRFKKMNENFNAAEAICADPPDKKVEKRCKKAKVLDNIRKIRLSEWIEQFNEGAEALKSAKELKEELKEEGLEEDEINDINDEIKGTYRDALQLFMNSTDIAPDSAQGWINIGICYYNIGLKDSAIIAYEKAIEHHPDDFDLLSNMATIYFELQDWESTEKTFRKMVLLQPDNVSVLKNDAMLLRQLKMDDSARVMMDRVLALDPNDTEIRRQRGFDEVFKGADYNGAMLNLRREDEKAHAAEIDSLIKLRDEAYAQVIEDFTVVTKNDPSDFDAWYYLGLSYRLLENDKEAINAFEHAVQLKPEDADIWEQLAVLYLKTGNKQKSDEALKKANDLKASSE